MIPRSIVLVAFLALAQPAAAVAPITVGAGTLSSCTEQALQDALATARQLGGGTIHFKCGGAVTIRLGDWSGIPDAAMGALAEPLDLDQALDGDPILALPNNTTIDGGGVITLAGAGGSILVFVDRDATAVLKNVKMTQRSLQRLAVNAGTLIVQNSTVSDTSSGGDILNTGTLSIENSTISNHRGHRTSALDNSGTLTVKNTILSELYGFSGGALRNSGTAIIENSTFSGNHGDGAFGSGGAIINVGGSLTVKGSFFVGNQALIAGAIANYGGTLEVANTIFQENWAYGPDGGSIASSGTLSVSNSEFIGNFGANRGGAIAASGDTVIHNTTFVGNEADRYGGAIYLGLGTLTVSNSTILRNIAELDGGGIYSCCGGAVELVHTVVTGNTPNDVAP